MKKIYLLIVSLSLTITQTALGQPTLTAVNSTYLAGESFPYHSGTSFTASPLLAISGANHSWDMSAAMQPLTDTNNFVTPASTPYASFYPSATVAEDNGSGDYGYFNASSSEINLLGDYSASNSLIYTDFLKEISYPFTYGNSYTDNYSDGGMGKYGTITASADGYGTLILPYGTFTNLLRVYYHNINIDTTAGNTDTIFNDLYVWYKPGTHAYLAEYYALSSGAFTIYGIRYLDQSSVGIENLAGNDNGFSVYPNPANNVVFINLNSGNLSITHVELVTTFGQIVKTILPSGNGTFNQLDVSDIPKGVYFLYVWSGQNKMCMKVIIG